MKTFVDFLKDNDFASSLVLPNEKVKVALIYRGGDKVEYGMFYKGSLLFEGNDLRPSPLHPIDGLESIVDLLGFLCCKPGDTDPSYFKDYTAEQLDWCATADCEQLSWVLSDYEERSAEGHASAKEYFQYNFNR